jgi:hypothetical protein
MEREEREKRTRDQQDSGQRHHPHFTSELVRDNGSNPHAYDLARTMDRSLHVSTRHQVFAGHGNITVSPSDTSPSGDVQSIQLESTFRVGHRTELLYEAGVGDDAAGHCGWREAC